MRRCSARARIRRFTAIATSATSRCGARSIPRRGASPTWGCSIASSPPRSPRDSITGTSTPMSRSSRMGASCRRGKTSPGSSTSEWRRDSERPRRSSASGSRKTRRWARPIPPSEGRARALPGARPRPHHAKMTDAASPASSTLHAVEEVPVWLDLNRAPAVTWMCSPDQLDDLVIGWLFGEGYIDRPSDILKMRPCATEPGFWVEIAPERYQTVELAERRRVLASGCGSVTTILGSLSSVPRRRAPLPAIDLAVTRTLFKALFQRGERYAETGGVHAAALTDGISLLFHAEDIGRHNAVDKVLGAAIQAGKNPEGLILLVTGRISGELAYKAARAKIGIVATPSVPSTIAVDIARAAGMVLIGRAVSGSPQHHFT